MALTRLAALLCLLHVGHALRVSRLSADIREQVCVGPNCFLAKPTNSIQTKSSSTKTNRLDVDPTPLYPAYNISVPIDHFHNDSIYEPHSNETFNLRYWFDASYYEAGGPVIVLEGGETSGEGRLPFLQKGILYQLAKATRGIGVVLEHRYYGESWPVPDLSTENLRFLTTDQALADTAYFAKNVRFPGLDNLTLTAPDTPYIAYGGSYAGAFVAFLRKLYPEIFFGAISSSGVTEAIYDYWEYYEAQRLHAPQDCVNTTQELTNVVDNILIGKNQTSYEAKLREVFGLGNLTYNDDFANLLSYGISGWQSRNWDPEENDPSFSEYCANITSDSLLYPGTAALNSTAYDLLDAGGYSEQASRLAPRLLNFIGYVNLTQVSQCVGKSQDYCFSNHNTTYYAQDDISQTWRAWPYQYCTQWGYLQTGSGVPSDQLPLVSRLLDLDYLSIVCRDAFNITTPPDVDSINKYGGFDISYPRLAIVDGEADPWRQATPHASVAPNRTSTVSEPFILIQDAVHHWDENGLFPNETKPDLPPPPVASAQQAEHDFVLEWLKEWSSERSYRGMFFQ
ncbi:serine carboxypeptidase S28-domain-containing protein [Phyllosticta citrichinensis]